MHFQSDYDVSKFWDLKSIGMQPREADHKLEFDAGLEEFHKMYPKVCILNVF